MAKTEAVPSISIVPGGALRHIRCDSVIALYAQPMVPGGAVVLRPLWNEPGSEIAVPAVVLPPLPSHGYGRVEFSINNPALSDVFLLVISESRGVSDDQPVVESSIIPTPVERAPEMAEKRPRRNSTKKSRKKARKARQAKKTSAEPRRELTEKQLAALAKGRTKKKKTKSSSKKKKPAAKKKAE